ncbi:MAG: heparinase II/III family protein [Runella sp.]
MKKIMFLWLVSQTIFAQNLPSHPRILLLAGEEKAIQKTITTDPHWAKIHRVVIEESDKMLALEPLQRIQIGRRLLATSREALRRIFYLSYSYRLTSERKYLQRAEAELLAVSAFSDWNPSHFLDVGEMTMAVAIGYDWLYADLQASTKEKIREAILKKGIEPSLDSRYNTWLTASHNWNQVCNAGMTYGALAIYEDQPALAKQIIDRAVNSIKLPMQDYAPHGGYPEGYSYWGYGTSFNVLFLSAIQRALGNEFGLTQAPGFLSTATYYQALIGTSGKSFNYADAGNSRESISPAVFWFASRTQDASLLFNIKKVLQKDGTPNIGNDRILPAALVWGRSLSIEKATTPTSLVWWGQGKTPVAMLRSSWTDPNAIYVGLKAGSPSVNHAHMDVGSFVMDALGERWSMDFGMQDYESLESKGVQLWGREQNAQRWQVFRYNNFVHSTLTFNGQLQRVEGYAKIESVTTKPPFISATTDLSTLYKDEINTVQRGVAIVDQQYVIVKDEIKTLHQPATVRWVMLTPADVRIGTSGEAILTQNGKSLTLKVTLPQNITLKTWPTTPTHDYDAPNPGTTLVGFETTLPANTTQTLSVSLIPQGVVVNKDTRIPSLKDWGVRK